MKIFLWPSAFLVQFWQIVTFTEAIWMAVSWAYVIEGDIAPREKFQIIMDFPDRL